jgi:hypothetical protein
MRVATKSPINKPNSLLTASLRVRHLGICSAYVPKSGHTTAPFGPLDPKQIRRRTYNRIELPLFLTVDAFGPAIAIQHGGWSLAVSSSKTRNQLRCRKRSLASESFAPLSLVLYARNTIYELHCRTANGQTARLLFDARRIRPPDSLGFPDH